MDPPKKPASRIVAFKNAQLAIYGTLEAWLPRLVESNDALEKALLLLRDLHLGRETLADEVVLHQVEDALDKAARAKRALSR
jgi:hypothetical protein